MAKFGVLKKITALATAIALVVCFAVSASAINVFTTTVYDADVDGEVTVNVTVTGAELTEGTNVTYYATNGSTPVHVDQVKVTEEGSASFNFNTADENLKSNVLIGYTDAGEAEEDSIKGFTVTYPGGSKKLPTAGGTVEFLWSAASGYMYDGVTTTGATPISDRSNGTTVTLVFGELSQDVTVEVKQTGDPNGATETVGVINAAAIKVGADFVSEKIYDEEGNEILNAEKVAEANAATGNRKLTVIGQTNTTEEFGILVSEAAITSKTYTEDEFTALLANAHQYAAKDKDAKGIFAVQLIDTSAEGDANAWVKADTDYFTAVYAKTANDCYKVVAYAEKVTTEVTE